MTPRLGNRPRSMPRKRLKRTEDGPTPQRLKKGGLERVVFDEMVGGHRRTGTHYVTVDALERMLRADTIKRPRYAAGRSFAGDFAVAQLDELHAPDLARIPGGAGRGDEVVVHVIAARERVSKALKAVGGYDSLGGSICWHVLGRGESIRRWTMLRGMGKDYGPGILVFSLQLLAHHYGYERLDIGGREADNPVN